MEKKGFTLIELLAVIVILAIIALIATPIILGIINDARQESNERSIELYVGAVKNGIASHQLTTGNKVEPKAYKSEELTFVEYEGDVECDTIEYYTDGSIYVADCKVNGVAVDYTYGTKQIIKGNLRSVCDPAQEQLYTTNPLELGYKYDCKVDPNKERYTFFVLSKDENKVNLIMDSNITLTGNPIKDVEPEDTGYIEWIKKGDYISEETGGTEAEWNLASSLIGGLGNNNKGPVTATKYLNTATSSWDNILNLNEKYNDENGHFTNFELNGKSRMPRMDEVNGTGCQYDRAGTCPLWMVNYMNYYGELYPGKNIAKEIHGYWILSSTPSDDYFYYARYVSSGGKMMNTYVGDIEGRGVRPVITLSI